MGDENRRGIWNYRRVEYLAGLSATKRAVLLAAVVGLVVLFLAWMSGPSLFAGAAEEERVVTATVTKPVPCTAAGAQETVRLPDKRTAKLTACGHEKGEKLSVAVPAEPDGELTARVADTAVGYNNARQNFGLLLMALACVGGGFYAWLVTRRQLTEPAEAAKVLQSLRRLSSAPLRHHDA